MFSCPSNKVLKNKKKLYFTNAPLVCFSYILNKRLSNKISSVLSQELQSNKHKTLNMKEMGDQLLLLRFRSNASEPPLPPASSVTW